MKIKHVPRVPIENLTCKGKVPYTSINVAAAVRDALMEKAPDKKFNIYICHHCGEYHIGGAK